MPWTLVCKVCFVIHVIVLILVKCFIRFLKFLATFGKCRYVYYGRHSEGNRFIRNNDLWPLTSLTPQTFCFQRLCLIRVLCQHIWLLNGQLFFSYLSNLIQYSSACNGLWLIDSGFDNFFPMILTEKNSLSWICSNSLLFFFWGGVS